ncbi:MAG: hypothetical protein J6D03_01140 [Clostridia bacterium]|nr:hypothetical protein [Clostridia bacterium]
MKSFSGRNIITDEMERLKYNKLTNTPIKNLTVADLLFCYNSVWVTSSVKKVIEEELKKVSVAQH